MMIHSKYYKEKKTCLPRIHNQIRLSSKNERVIKIFSDKQKQRRFITTISALKEVLKEVLQVERMADRNTMP
jgi:translation initiation factor 1 (eIF-1/SUI1)